MMRPAALLLAAALGVCGGCATPPATRYYVLTPTAAAPAVPAAAPLTVFVRDVQLPQYLDRRQIVSRGGEHRLQVNDGEQWAGELRQDLTRVLVENLGRLLASERIFAAPHNLRLTPDYRIELEILRFEREAGGRVALAARWTLTRVADASLLASPSQTLFGATLPEGAPYEALVASMSAVYGELARAVADSVRAAAESGK